MSTITSPLCELLKKDVLWQWNAEQENAFQLIQKTLSEAPVLQLFNPEKPVTIQCDASSKGLGACLIQEDKPVAYTSRSLTETECRYAQIEKEIAAVDCAGPVLLLLLLQQMFVQEACLSPVTDGAWILVYRAQAENNVSAYGVYNNSGYVSDKDLSSLPLSSISKTGDVTSSHYRSRWINEWPSNISQVKFELYTQGQTVLTLLFNATGSNSTNWFSHNRLIQSPFTDLTWPPVIFSSTGYPNTRRRFCITNATSFIDCTQKSWLLVEDTVDTTCSWTSGATKTFPRFQYSKTSTFTTFSTKTQGLANVLAVFIKF
uniref:Reverse transcriptase/retrotransposon-derived protein RNase H-like domain-containing protein n=1 Tax=Biomphalaria glabrata TaxID=6526 RepID=A0A2C9LN25_BIOGL